MRRIEIIDENTGEFLEDKVVLEVLGLDLVIDLNNIVDLTLTSELDVIYSYNLNKLMLREDSKKETNLGQVIRYEGFFYDGTDDEEMLDLESILIEFFKPYIEERNFKFSENKPDEFSMKGKHYLGNKIDNVIYVKTSKTNDKHIGNLELNGKNLRKNDYEKNRTDATYLKFELGMLYVALTNAMKLNINKVATTCELVIDHWSKYNCKSEDVSIQELSKKTSELREEFEKNGGKVYLEYFFTKKPKVNEA